MAEVNEQQKKWAKAVAKAWEDEAFKKRLLDDPAALLAEDGVKFPEGKKIKVIEAGENEVYLVLPPKPSDEQLAEIGEDRLAASGPCQALCSI